MSLQAEIIPFTLPTPAGATSFSVSHVRYPSIAGKGFIFLCADNTGTISDVYGFGVDDGTTHIGTGLGLGDAFGGRTTARGYSTVYSLITEQSQAFFGGAAVKLKGYISAVNVGSFTITLDQNDTPGAQWYAVMIGGDGVECKVGQYDVTAGTGDTDVGFDPAAVIKLGTIDSGTGEVAGAYMSYGFAVPCDDNQVAWAANLFNLQATSYQIDGKIQQDIASSATTLSDPVTISAWITDGWTNTISGTPDWNIGYLAIGGSAVSANLVSITQPTSTGAQSVPITATDPVFALFASTNKVATSGAGNNDGNLTFGVYDGTSKMCQWWGGTNGNTNHDRVSSTANAIFMATATGLGTSTTNAEATCTFSSAQLNVNWVQVDSTQREVWALVLAQNLTGSPNVCGANPQASITVLKQCTPIAGGETDFPFSSASLTPTSFTLLDGESQLFANVTPGTYNISESAPSGWTATYASSNGSPHSALTVGSGEAVTLTVTNTLQTSTPTFRIYRRFALPYNEHYLEFLSRLEIIAQMAVGNSDAPNPEIKIRFSKNGGATYGSFRTMTLGTSTQYSKRAYVNRVGRSRNWVAELICDDPVVVGWIQCAVEGEQGTN